MDHLCARRSRREFFGLLGVGAAVVLTGCGTTPSAGVGAGVGAGARAAGVVVPPLPAVPAPRPGPSEVLAGGPKSDRRIVLTVDDGTCADCVAGYVEFAQRSGTHLTFSPNGVYDREWAPHAPVLRPLIATGQVQIMNHTFSHLDLRTMSEPAIRQELERNDEWVVKNFGITTRPYYRPPFGFHTPTVDGVAAGLGYTRTVMWNGSYSDADLDTPEFLMSQAQKYLEPGVIMLGHANHPTVLGLFDQILAVIHDRRLTPVTLDEMFGTARAIGAA